MITAFKEDNMVKEVKTDYEGLMNWSVVQTISGTPFIVTPVGTVDFIADDIAYVRTINESGTSSTVEWPVDDLVALNIV